MTMKIYITKEHSKKKDRYFIALVAEKKGKKYYLSFSPFVMTKLTEMTWDDIKEYLDEKENFIRI